MLQQWSRLESCCSVTGPSLPPNCRVWYCREAMSLWGRLKVWMHFKAAPTFPADDTSAVCPCSANRVTASSLTVWFWGWYNTTRCMYYFIKTSFLSSASTLFHTPPALPSWSFSLAGQLSSRRFSFQTGSVSAAFRRCRCRRSCSCQGTVWEAGSQSVVMFQGHKTCSCVMTGVSERLFYSHLRATIYSRSLSPCLIQF